MESIPLDDLPSEMQSRILGKLNFMDDILSGRIEKPPGMTITAGPSPLDNLLKAVKSEMKMDKDDEKESKSKAEETSSALFECAPPSKNPPPLFDESSLHALSTSNKHDSNPVKYPLSNTQILSLQTDGYLVIDNYIKDNELIQQVQTEIDTMRQAGKMKRAGLRRFNTENDKQNIEITGSGCREINGVYGCYKKCKDLAIVQLLSTHFKALCDVCYVKNHEYGIARIETTEKLSLFVSSKCCWIVFKYTNAMHFPIVYYVAECDGKNVMEISSALEWKCIGGMLPFGAITCTNKWLSSTVRSDLHCWLHSDDKDIGKSLKRCVVSMDEIRVQLNKLVKFNSNTTQVQATLYPGNGAQYVTHVDEPPNIKKETAKRKLTCLVYFNLCEEETWDSEKYGGSLRIYLGDNVYQDIEPLAGRLVLFNSQWLPHQVMPCYFNRYAVTLWMY